MMRLSQEFRISVRRHPQSKDGIIGKKKKKAMTTIYAEKELMANFR